MTIRRRIVPAAVTVAAAWVFGGAWGLVAAAVVAVAWALVPIPRRMLWIAAVALIAATPIAIMAQGLPSGPIPGPGFGRQHMVAHVIVGLAMVFILLAALDELVTGGRSDVGPAGDEADLPPSAGLD
jgi:hypothetical protein